jgi:hypothetical protein
MPIFRRHSRLSCAGIMTSPQPSVEKTIWSSPHPYPGLRAARRSGVL